MIKNNTSSFKFDQNYRIKGQKDRYIILDEWVRTQNKYIADLNFIISKISLPLIEKSLVSIEEQRLIFCNLNTMISLSGEILNSLELFVKQWKPKTIKLSETFSKIYPFLQIYSQYCNNYQKTQVILSRLKNNSIYQNLQKQMPAGQDIDSYLIKPIQRFHKYLYFLKDYQAKMETGHPDYSSLNSIIEKYQAVKNKNNLIQKHDQQTKLMHIQKLYNDLSERPRQFLRQFNGSTITQKIKIYILTDVILITKFVNTKEQLKQVIELDGFSYISQEVNTKYFQNKVLVCGKFQCTHIIFESEYETLTFCEFLTQIIQNLHYTQQNQQNMRSFNKSVQKIKVKMTLNYINILDYMPEFKIFIMGAEKRPQSLIINQTIYIIKYELNKNAKIFQYVYTKFSSLEQLHQDLQLQYQSIPSLDAQLFNIDIQDKVNRTKLIEYRTILIIEFLNILLRNPKIIANPLYIIQKLKINEKLFQYSIKNNNVSECCQFSFKHKNFPQSFDQYLNQRRKYGSHQNQNNCINKFILSQQKIRKYDKSQCNTLQKIVVYLNAIQGRLDHIFIKNQSKQNHTIKIYYYNNTNQQQLQIKIDQYTTVNELLAKIQKQLSIKHLRDFGLFVKYGQIPRLLDEDQIIFDVIHELQGQILDIQNGFFGYLTSSCTKIKGVITGKKSKIILKKYFFLDQQLEKSNRQGDFEKFKLIIGQAFHYIQKQILVLNEEQLLKLLSYYILLKQPQKIYYLKKQSFPQNKVKQYLKQLKKQKFIIQQTHIKKIISIIGVLKIEFDSKKDNILFFLYRKIIQLVQNKINWNSCLFSVVNHYPSKIKDKPVDLLIGVNHKNVYLIQSKTVQPINDLIMPLDNFQYRTTPFSISFYQNKIKYRFNGKLLYNLQKLINRYQLYNKVFLNKESSYQITKNTINLNHTKNYI